jgi:galactokinase
MEEAVAEVVKVFQQKFHSKPVVVIAPARINLIGEHTDYNEGFVMPAAIDKHLVFAMAPGRSEHCNIFANDFKEGVRFLLSDLNPGDAWVNYVMGVIDGFQRRELKLSGVDCVFGGNIPAGAGLSSSAALCSGFGFALNEIFKTNLSRIELARIAQRSEHEFAGVMCGIMDMYASLFGEKKSALLLDCRTETHETLPISLKDFSFVLIDTKVKHALASTGYNDRRASCEQGVKILHKKNAAVNSLRDVSLVMLYENQDALGEDVFIKCQFVVKEIERTLQAAKFLKSGDLLAFGNLMYETHWGLSQAYDVSCEELDLLVSLAEEDRDKVIGARMMGGGFGGCTINLVANGHMGAFSERVRENYFATFKKEPDFYQVNLSRGVHLWKE